jgi:hypothetical protein
MFIMDESRKEYKEAVDKWQLGEVNLEELEEILKVNIMKFIEFLE